MNKKSIVFRMDGSRELGLGHVMRCMTVASALERLFEEKKISQSIHFVTRDNKGARNAVSGTSFENSFRWIAWDGDENREFREVLDELEPAVVVTDIDLRGRLDAYLETIFPCRHVSLHEHNFSIVARDRVIAPTIRSLPHHKNTQPGISSFVGLEYLLLPLEILDMRESLPEPTHHVKTIAVTMGGGDPSGLTPKILNAARAYNNPNITWIIILGPATIYDSMEFERNFPSLGKCVDGKSLSRKEFIDILVNADIVVTNGGTTAYESLALGRPTVSIPQNEFEGIVSGMLAEKGACVMPLETGNASILETMSEFIDDKDLRREAAMKGRELIDGKGALRVGEIILGLIK